MQERKIIPTIKTRDVYSTCQVFSALVRVETSLLRIKQHTVQDIVFALPVREHALIHKKAWSLGRYKLSGN